MTTHEVELYGILWHHGDIGIDTDGKHWRAQRCITASGENSILFQQFGDGISVYRPAKPLRRFEDLTERLLLEVSYHVEARNRLVKHSMFAYPHFWLWHALFDGTWLCRCWHSQEYKSSPHS